MKLYEDFALILENFRIFIKTLLNFRENYNFNKECTVILGKFGYFYGIKKNFDGKVIFEKILTKFYSDYKKNNYKIFRKSVKNFGKIFYIIRNFLKTPTKF